MRWRTDIRTAFESLDRFRAGAQGIRTFELPSRLLIAFALCGASLHERLSDLQRHCNRNGYNDQREEQDVRASIWRKGGFSVASSARTFSPTNIVTTQCECALLLEQLRAAIVAQSGDTLLQSILAARLAARPVSRRELPKASSHARQVW